MFFNVLCVNVCVCVSCLNILFVLCVALCCDCIMTCWDGLCILLCHVVYVVDYCLF